METPAVAFMVACKGRGVRREEVFTKPIRVQVSLECLGDSTLVTRVRCPHNTGVHGHRCAASGSAEGEVGEGVRCAYALELPRANDVVF